MIYSTISIEKSTRERLKSFASKDETYDDFLKRAMDFIEEKGRSKGLQEFPEKKALEPPIPAPPQLEIDLEEIVKNNLEEVKTIISEIESEKTAKTEEESP